MLALRGEGLHMGSTNNKVKTEKELTVEEARRIASAAKSLLSRRYNEMNEALRNSQSTFEDYCVAHEAYQQQQDRFRTAVREWRRLHEAQQ